MVWSAGSWGALGSLLCLLVSQFCPLREFRSEDGKAVIPLGTTVQGDVLLIIYHARSTLGGRLQAKVSATGRGAVCWPLAVPSALHAAPGNGSQAPRLGFPGCWAACFTRHGPGAIRAWPHTASFPAPITGCEDRWSAPRPDCTLSCFHLLADGLHEDVPDSVPHRLRASERHHREICKVRWCQAALLLGRRAGPRAVG